MSALAWADWTAARALARSTCRRSTSAWATPPNLSCSWPRLSCISAARSEACASPRVAWAAWRPLRASRIPAASRVARVWPAATRSPGWTARLRTRPCVRGFRCVTRRSSKATVPGARTGRTIRRVSAVPKARPDRFWPAASRVTKSDCAGASSVFAADEAVIEASSPVWAGPKPSRSRSASREIQPAPRSAARIRTSQARRAPPRRAFPGRTSGAAAAVGPTSGCGACASVSASRAASEAVPGQRHPIHRRPPHRPAPSAAADSTGRLTRRGPA